MIRITLVLSALFCLFVSLVVGQQTRIDSLRMNLATSTDTSEKVDLLGAIGSYFYDTQVYYDSAFYYTEKAYVLAKDEKLEFAQAYNLFNLGRVSNSIKNHEQAIGYYSQSLEITKRLNKSNVVASTLNNIGGAYFELEKYDNAIEYYREALSLSKEANDTVSIGVDYMNIGEAQYKVGRLEKSKATLELSLEYLAQVKVDFPTVRLFYARTLFSLNELEAAQKQASQSLELAEAYRDLKMIAEAAEVLSDIALKEDRHEEALSYYKKFVIHKDSLNTAKELNEIEKLKLNFELNKTEEELAYISTQNAYLNTIYALAALGVILLVFLVFRQLKVTRMTRQIHEVQNRLIKEELDKRDSKKEAANTFQATIAQDKELD